MRKCFEEMMKFCNPLFVQRPSRLAGYMPNDYKQLRIRVWLFGVRGTISVAIER